MRNNGEQDVSEVTDMSVMFAHAKAFASDVSAWVRRLWPTVYRTCEHLFNCMVRFPGMSSHTITHTFANGLWKLVTPCEITGSRMSPKLRA